MQTTVAHTIAASQKAPQTVQLGCGQEICSRASRAVDGGHPRLQVGNDLPNAQPLIYGAQLAVEGSAMQGPFLAAEVSLQPGSPQLSCTLTTP